MTEPSSEHTPPHQLVRPVAVPGCAEVGGDDSDLIAALNSYPEIPDSLIKPEPKTTNTCSSN